MPEHNDEPTTPKPQQCWHENRYWDSDLQTEVCEDCRFHPEKEQIFYGFWEGWDAALTALREQGVRDATFS